QSRLSGLPPETEVPENWKASCRTALESLSAVMRMYLRPEPDRALATPPQPSLRQGLQGQFVIPHQVVLTVVRRGHATPRERLPLWASPGGPFSSPADQQQTREPEAR